MDVAFILSGFVHTKFEIINLVAPYLPILLLQASIDSIYLQANHDLD
jgi:hypothetical protein